MSQLLEFYRGTGSDARGRVLSQIWNYSDRELEYHHDFIQWLFPLLEPSQFNPDAPTLSDEDIRAFQGDPLLRENLLRSFDRILSFLGLARQAEGIKPGPGFASRQGLFSTPNHNWLRITRVMTSLRLLGLQSESQALLTCLHDMDRRGLARISSETMTYWNNAARPTGLPEQERGASEATAPR